MRKFHLCFLFLGIMMLTSNELAAQGWVWGAGSYQNASEDGIESWPIAVDKSGNVFEAGMIVGADTAQFGTFTIYSTDTITYPLLITKTDSSGHFLWAIMSHSNTDVLPISIEADDSGNLYLLALYDSSELGLGTVTLYNPNDYDMYFLAKISPLGTVLWAENVAPTVSYITGIFDYQGLGGLGIDGTGNVFVTGAFNIDSITIGTTTLHDSVSITNDIFLAKFDASGVSLWAKGFGGTGGSFPMGLTVSPSGGVLVIGYAGSPSVSFDTVVLHNAGYFLSRLDSSGHMLWARAFGGQFVINSLASDPSMNSYVAGIFSSPVILGTTTFTPTGPQDFMLARFDSAGNFSWGSTGGGTGKSIGPYSVAYDFTCGYVWASGYYGYNGYPNDSIYFSGHMMAVPPDTLIDESFLVEYDAMGNYITSIALKEGGEDNNAITTDQKGNLYLGGDYASGGGYFYPFILGPDTLVASAAGQLIGQENLFVAKYHYTNDLCETLQATSKSIPAPAIVLFPNPAYKEITVSSTSSISCIKVYDILGRIVYNNSFKQQANVTIDVACLRAGIYIVKVNEAEVVKFVKE